MDDYAQRASVAVWPYVQIGGEGKRGRVQQLLGTADVAPPASAPCRAIDEVTTCFHEGRLMT